MQRHFTILGVTLASALVAAVPARACSMPPPPSVQEAFAQASAVYLAQVASVKQEPGASGSITEKVVFRVLVTLKGNKRRGETLLAETADVGDTCGRSVLNNPAWVEDDDPSSHKSTPVKLSDTWVLYLSGREPYDMSSNSNPINLVDPAELRFLFAQHK